MKHLYRMMQIFRQHTPLLRHDGIRLTAATAFVGATLFGLYSVAGGPPISVIDEAAVAARLTDALRQQARAVEARRVGTIVFASAEKYCEEYKFDNTTGYVVGIDTVDCEERLTRDADVKKEAAKSANMKGMLASFKK